MVGWDKLPPPQWGSSSANPPERGPTFMYLPASGRIIAYTTDEGHALISAHLLEAWKMVEEAKEAR